MSKEELENKDRYIYWWTCCRTDFPQHHPRRVDDIEQATKIARGMISRYGMSDEFDMVAMESMNNQYLGGDSKPELLL